MQNLAILKILSKPRGIGILKIVIDTLQFITMRYLYSFFKVSFYKCCKVIYCKIIFFFSFFPIDTINEKIGLYSFLKKNNFFSIFIAGILLSKSNRQYKNNFCNNDYIPKIPKQHLRLSVIIPTFNRSDLLIGLFESLKKQNLDRNFFEIVVVNNNCTDDTDQVCKKFSYNFPHFSIVHEPGQSLLSARHAGWRAAKADILVFCDDDIEAFPTWLSTIDKAFSSEKKLGLMGGNNIGKFFSPLPSWFEEFWVPVDNDFRINCYYSLIEGIKRPCYQNNPYVFGCNFSIRRAALEYAHGFEPDCMQHLLFQGGGESGIISMLSTKWHILLHPGASVYHRMPSDRLSLDYLKKRILYFTAESFYSAFRHNMIPRNPQINFSILSDYKNEIIFQQNKMKESFLEAIFLFPDFRDWLIRPSYFDSEIPNSNILDWANLHVKHATWHTK